MADVPAKVKCWMLEAVLLIALLSLSLIPFGGIYCQSRLVVWTVFLAGIVAVVSLAATLRRTVPLERSVPNRPVETVTENYTSSCSCRACHPHHYATWHASYHRTMTQVATRGTVLGDFNNVELHDVAGQAYRLTSEDDEFFVEWSGSDYDAQFERRRVVMMTGSHHYQAYWYETGKGRELGMLPFVYLVDRTQYDPQRWIDRRAAFLRPPLPPGARPAVLNTGRWNKVCVMCHTTRGRPQLASQHGIDTEVVEFGISCEACHGPGGPHVSANQQPLRRYKLHVNSTTDDTIIQPERLSHVRSSQVCGQCHSAILPLREGQWDRWHDSGFAYRPGDDLAETRFLTPSCFELNPQNVRRLKGLAPDAEAFLTATFWTDGMVRVSGREYSGLVASPCYQRGTMSCLTCHQMHKDSDDPRSLSAWANDQLRPGMETNAACLQCHERFADSLEQHTHHPAESSGSLCYNCHMPHTAYGLLKAIRSHQIDSPNVSHSLAPVGRPNACNQCHLDKTLAWTAQHLDNWYGIEQPKLSDREQTVAASVLWLLKGDAGQRALAAWTMGWPAAKTASGSDWISPFLIQMLLEPYDSVRYIVARSLRNLPGYEDVYVDFMSPFEARFKVVQQSLSEWRSDELVERPQGRPAVLMNRSGSIDIDQMRKLLFERDNRPVYLNE